MPTSQNSNYNRDSNTAKKTYTPLRYGNDHGHICFGQISKKGDVISDVLLQGSDGRHAIAMDKDGPRKGWTTVTSPGNFQVLCGFDSEIRKEQDSMLISAERGNIHIVAQNGKIIFQGDDIEFIAVGEKSNEGNVRVKAKGSIELDAPKVFINSSIYTKITSSGKIEIIANGLLRTYGSVIQGVTAAVSQRDSKVGGRSFQQAQQLSGS